MQSVFVPILHSILFIHNEELGFYVDARESIPSMLLRDENSSSNGLSKIHNPQIST